MQIIQRDVIIQRKKEVDNTMSQMERILTWCLCLAPVVALVLVFPWKKLFNGTLFKKKEKTPKPAKEERVKEKKTKKTEIITKPIVEHETESVQEVAEENVEEEASEDKPVANREFAEFLQARRRRVAPPPRRFEENRDFTRFPNPFNNDEDSDMPNFRRQQKQEKTVAEELETISPELKALIISGALDRKNFDDIGENK